MRIVIGALLSLTIGVGAAFAQAPAPSTTTAPAAQPAAPAKLTADQKKAISKSCSDQATAKGLHGKARKKFRAECKKNGGTAPAQ
jgi:psiF repeat